MCQEHMDKEIARYNLKPKDYKKSCKRGFKIVSEKTVVKKKAVNKKREDILSPSMKAKVIKFAEDTNILKPKYK